MKEIAVGCWGAQLSHAEAQAFKVLKPGYSRSSGNYNLELRQSPTSGDGMGHLLFWGWGDYFLGGVALNYYTTFCPP